jgi:hypothetical protein
MHLGGGVLGAALLAVTAPGAWAQAAKAAPVALVMQISGTTDPPLARHREVGEGTKVTVKPNSSLALLHYTSCSIVTLNGGTATITADAVVAPAANIASTKPGPCPKVHKIALDGRAATGGVSLSRAVGPSGVQAPLNFAANGTVVLAGAGAARAKSYDILDGYDRTVVKDAPVRDGTFTLDGSAKGQGPYKMRIHFAKASDPIEVPVFLRASDGGVLVLQTD